MNSYPHEFLAHPQPLMFIAGLSSAASGPSTAGPSTTGRSESHSSSGVGSSSRRASVSPTPHLDPSSAVGSALGLMSMTSPLNSPGPTVPVALPSSPPSGDAETAPSSPRLPDDRDEEFRGLVDNLRSALTGSGGKGKVWLHEAKRKTFRILLVDKAVRLPLRKILPTSSQTSPELSQSAHSPLSPLTPSSPLFPDGLIAPVWVRKHAELVPSVFVMFLRLYEPPEIPQAGLNPEEVKARDLAQKESDDGLIKEIGERRRRLGERGIKLTVVLMATASTLDSSALDPRLSYIRRSSALSSKASLFVLTPVPAEQLPDFVQSLQDALFESAIEYYSSHSKRIRRKRSRVPANQLSVPTSGVGEKGKSLANPGWIVRYDWKAGWFAEVRGDLDAARRHYEDCWNELAKMFSSTQMLPPRTKRWAEAKVLADCVAVRICKLLLYQAEGPKVLGPFFVHIKRFGDLSRGWGIGEETFEFWSWISRQYRIFAELLELGVQHGLRIPILTPPVLPTASAAVIPPTAEYFATPISSGNPLQVMQQPAFYFYTAACCSVQRQKRFQEALVAEKERRELEAGTTSVYVSTAPGFDNEKKVDHAALVIELFTKAYSLLKEHSHGPDRLALFVAFRIAETYCQSGQHEMAMRFFDKISVTFKQDKWHPIVGQIRELWYECAQQTGSVETAARLLLEKMCPGNGATSAERLTLQAAFLTLLQTTSPSTTEPIVLDMADESSLLTVQAGFWDSNALVSRSVPFQLVIASSPETDILDIQFSSLHICFSDNRPDLVIKAGDKSSPDLQVVDFGEISGKPRDEKKSSLRWTSNSVLVVSGQILANEGEEIQVTAVRLRLVEGSWTIDLALIPGVLQEWQIGKQPIAPVQELSLFVNFVAQPHAINLEVVDETTAYTDEMLPITVQITNDDQREMKITLSAELQSANEGDASSLVFESQESKTLLTDISLGILSPGASKPITVQLSCAAPGTKAVSFSARSTLTATASESNEDDLPATSIGEETIKTAVIPVLDPFRCEYTVDYRHLSARANIHGRARVYARLAINGVLPLLIESLELHDVDGSQGKLASSSLSALTKDAFPQTWTEHSTFSVVSVFHLPAPDHRPSFPNTEPPATLTLKWRRSPSSPLIETVLPLPPLSPPQRESFLSASLRAPPSARLHHPFDLQLLISNAHPTSPAIGLSVQVDTADQFAWLGGRNVGLPDVLPGDTREIDLTLRATGGTGWCSLPVVRVWDGDGEGEDRREVKVESGGDEGGVRGMIFVKP